MTIQSEAYRPAKMLASLFIHHKGRQVKPANGKSYPQNLQLVRDAPPDAEVRSAMLKDPQLPVPSMMAVQAPNKVSLTRMGPPYGGNIQRFNGNAETECDASG